MPRKEHVRKELKISVKFILKKFVEMSTGKDILINTPELDINMIL